MNDSRVTNGPHGRIAVECERDRLAQELFDALWDRYRRRVEHVAAYERVIADAGATFVNDHIAFRTFGWQLPTAGIVSVSRIFETLGYRAAGCYHFPDKHLGAIHFQHPNGQFPKLFISELQSWELPETAREIIGRTVAGH
ncbi:MAG: 2-oxoadipate dioxygenase/decarboxylase family protein, partial [Planctomycetaceae bacterium]